MLLVSGLGFGIISGAFAFVNVLSDMTGPGTLGINGQTQIFFIASSLLTLCFVLLHTCWSVIMFSALSIENYKSYRLWIGVGMVVASHFLASGIVIDYYFNNCFKLFLLSLDTS